MAKTITLALGIHNHQPVGNFDFVFEDAYRKSYRPFLEILERHPGVRLALHYTGPLLQWLHQHHPKTVRQIRGMVARGQVEMLTGGLYEPIFSIIPDRDKHHQILGLTRLVRRRTGYRPEGMWMAERVWEPHLPLALSGAGVRYVVLDDSHFKYAGLTDEQLLGYYLTEEQGAGLRLFPISKKLRYTIPFQEPEETIEHLRELATGDGRRVAVFADDGEKFGSWPDTYRHCYEDGWLERFFGALEANADWLNVCTFGELIRSHPPLGRIYLPTASYAEMMEWALPAEAIAPFEGFQKILEEKSLLESYGIYVRAGFWRNFLAKYPESNNLHKKMLLVSGKVQALREEPDHQSAARRAEDELFRGQCNDAYWHGVFGGLYLPHLRSAIYHHLIAAERIADRALHTGGEWIEARTVDFDGDGAEEILIHGPQQNLYFHPRQGGSLFELDYKPLAFNLLDTLARRKEGYHHKLTDPPAPSPGGEGVASIHDRVVVKEQGLERLLHYDWHRRVSLLDHFPGPETTLEDFSRGQYQELGDFVTGEYQHRLRRGRGTLTLILSREGRLWPPEGPVPVTVSKRITLPAGGSWMEVRYRLESPHPQGLSAWFGVELNYALLAGSAPDRYYLIEGARPEDPRLVSVGEAGEVASFGLRDEYLGLDIALTVNRPARLWRFPIETVSQSEGGFERVYQSSVLFPSWQVDLQPGERWEVVVRQELRRL
jgi:alpha-amylase